MATIKDKVDRHLNDTFIDNLHEYLKEQYPDVEFDRTIDIESMRMVSTWDSEDPETCAEIKKVAGAYEAAYLKARQEIWNA